MRIFWPSILFAIAFAAPGFAAKKGGADWWSLQPVKRPELPPVKNAKWVRNPIDTFVLAQLEAQRLTPSPEASARVLQRRLHFDLIGLPPTGPINKPHGKLVEELLSSPHYGERWARHWLDVARFGESQGFERDKLRPNSWRYRDWVVEAFNRDLPYNQFARMQIAGDVLTKNSAEGFIATGFLVGGAWDEVGQSQQSAAMKAVVRQDELEDYVSTIGQSFLGLTIHCARCHNHKFDPISQTEYYELTAALDGLRHGQRNVPVTTQPNAFIEARVKELEVVRSDQHDANWTAERRHLDQQRKRWAEKKIYTIAPRQPGATHVLGRGNPRAKKELVKAGGVKALRGVSEDFGLAENAPEGERRRKLAGWITHRDNPLFARVIVNRLWHYHFGRGIVDTPSDFGFNGGRPSHPALLDWLAAELVANKWSLKHIHRLILKSATWRQASLIRPEAAGVDAGNRLLWRMNPRRLEAEALRDAILKTSGQLQTALGGPGFYDFTTHIHNTQFYSMKDFDGATWNRRSLYRTWVRSGRSMFLDTFDCPDPSARAPKRAVTTTPLQSLALLNNSFVLRMANHFAARIKTEAGDNIQEQITRGFQLALYREPTPEEIRLTTPLVRNHGLRSLCRALVNSSEFFHID